MAKNRKATARARLYRSYKSAQVTVHQAAEKGVEVPFSSKWHNFDAFCADVGEPPSPEHTLRRITLKTGFVPGNMIWRLWKGVDKSPRAVFQARILAKVKEANARPVG